MRFVCCVKLFLFWLPTSASSLTLDISANGSCSSNNILKLNISYSVIPKKGEDVKSIKILLYQLPSVTPVETFPKEKFKDYFTTDINIKDDKMSNVFKSKLNVEYNDKRSHYNPKRSDTSRSITVSCNTATPLPPPPNLVPILVSTILIFTLIILVCATLYYKLGRTTLKVKTWSVERTDESGHLGLIHAKLEAITKALLNKPQQHINVYIIFIDDHSRHQKVVLEFARYLQADLGFNVFFELFQSEQIFTSRVAWMQDCLEKSNKVIVIWSPGASKQWKDYHSKETAKYDDMFIPILKNIKKDLFYNRNVGKYFFGYFEYCNEDDIPNEFRKYSNFKLMKQFEELYFHLMDIEMYMPGAVIREKRAALNQYFDESLNKHGPLLQQYIFEMCAHVKDKPNWHALPERENVCVNIDTPVFLCNDGKSQLMCNEFSITPIVSISDFDSDLNKCSEVTTRTCQTKISYCRTLSSNPILCSQTMNNQTDVSETSVVQCCGMADKSAGQTDWRPNITTSISKCTADDPSNLKETSSLFAFEDNAQDISSFSSDGNEDKSIHSNTVPSSSTFDTTSSATISEAVSSNNNYTPILQQQPALQLAPIMDGNPISVKSSSNELSFDDEPIPQFVQNDIQDSRVNYKPVCEFATPLNSFSNRAKPIACEVDFSNYDYLENGYQQSDLQLSSIPMDVLSPTDRLNTKADSENYSLLEDFQQPYASKSPVQITKHDERNNYLLVFEADSDLYSYSENLQEAPLKLAPMIMDKNPMDILASINNVSMDANMPSESKQSPMQIVIHDERNNDLLVSEADSGNYSYSENLQETPLKLAPIVMDKNPMDILASINNISMNM